MHKHLLAKDAGRYAPGSGGFPGDAPAASMARTERRPSWKTWRRLSPPLRSQPHEVIGPPVKKCFLFPLHTRERLILS